jgi:sugar lactone lactonase YvrE
MKMTLSGEESVVAGALLSPNSVIVHPDGMVFTTAFDAILEVIPGSGTVTTLVEPGGYDLDGLTLSRDFQYLWFNEDELGGVYRVRVDGTGDATLMAEVDLAQGVELDGMTTDICGNVYALHTDGHVTRIRPDGRTDEFVKLDPVGDDMWTSAVHFGSGRGGWRADALYIMDRFGGLFEVEVGVPGVPEPHL